MAQSERNYLVVLGFDTTEVSTGKYFIAVIRKGSNSKNDEVRYVYIPYIIDRCFKKRINSRIIKNRICWDLPMAMIRDNTASLTKPFLERFFSIHWGRYKEISDERIKILQLYYI